MKRKQEDYTFSKLEIKILKEVARENHSLSSLMESLTIKPSRLSYNLKKLDQKGIILFKKKADRSRKYIYFADSKHASLLRELLVTYNHIKWESILADLGIEFLFQTLDHSVNVFRNISKVTSWRYFRNFSALGIITFGQRGYSINPRFSILEDFLIEYQRFLMNTLVRSISERAIILWQKDFECLVQAPKNSPVSQKNFMKTATSGLDAFGVHIFSEYDTYFYSKEKKNLRVEDVILHTLLIERDSVRYVTYGLLLLSKELEKIDKEYLFKEAQRFGLGLQVNAMLQFLETKGARTGLTLPTWAEFIDKAREYGVED
jgi:DNA-binding MarR family transcriptional regulator